jgi:hypothetical protein
MLESVVGVLGITLIVLLLIGLTAKIVFGP